VKKFEIDDIVVATKDIQMLSVGGFIPKGAVMTLIRRNIHNPMLWATTYQPEYSAVGEYEIMHKEIWDSPLMKALREG
jgi:hypothetical protein